MPSRGRVPSAPPRSVADPVGARTGALITPRTGLPPIRVLAGLVLAVALPALLTLALTWAGTAVGLAGDALVLLIAVVVTALVGGLWPAMVSAVIGSTLLNYFFIPPVRTFRIADSHNIWTVVGFVLVGALVSAVVHRAAATAAAASRAAAEARTLSAVAEATLAGEEALPSLLEQLRSSFGMTSATMLVRADSGAEHGPADGTRWEVLHSCGPDAPSRPEDADVQVPAGQDLVIAMAGRSLGARDRVILDAFAAQAQALLERDRLARSAAVAARLEATERLRDALLAAVGHDLRTPLASARAAVSSLHSRDVAWSEQERDELLATAEESLERLGALVSDLLDLSRLKAGVLKVARQAVWLDELVPPALAELGPAAHAVTLRLPDDLPPAVGDAALITRVLVNVIGNALKHAPAAQSPLVSGSASPAGVSLRVVDHGPGIAQSDREQVFRPFQRLGDTDNRAGLGLGLALSRGLVEAMDGSLEPEQTPGGGLTMVLTLPMAGDDRTAEVRADTPPGGEDR